VNKPQQHPTAQSRSICVIEVTRDRHDPAQWVQCLISISGHPATFSRTWPTDGYPVDDNNVRDLMTWIDKTVFDAIAVSVGVQDCLPGSAS
jgi:hypothetical protein